MPVSSTLSPGHFLMKTILLNGLSQVRFVLSVCLAVIHLDVDEAGRHYIALQCKPYPTKIGWLAEGAKPVEPLAARVEEVHPGTRGLGVFAAGGQIGGGGEKLRRVSVLVEHIVLIARKLFAACLIRLQSHQVKHGIREDWRRRSGDAAGGERDQNQAEYERNGLLVR